MAVNQSHYYRLTCDLCGHAGPVIDRCWPISSGDVRKVYRDQHGWRRVKIGVAGERKLVDVCAKCFSEKKHLVGKGSKP